jgi:hypothetical protein
VRIELLYLKGCPGFKIALDRVYEALRKSGIDAPVEMVEVNSIEEAEARRFLGSPSIRINGLDVGITARDSTNFGLTCRVYRTESGVEGSPSVEMINRAILEALGAELRSSDIEGRKT